MSKNELGRAINSPLVMKGEIDTNAVANIGLAKLESKLIGKEQVIRTAIFACEKACDKTQKALSKSIKDFAKSKLDSNVAALNKALKTAGFGKTTAKITSVARNADENEITAKVSITQINTHRGGAVDAEYTWNESAVIKKAARDLIATKELLSEENEKMAAIRHKMAMMPRLERQLKARCAEATLQDSEGGAALLDLIEAQADSFMEDIDA